MPPLEYRDLLAERQILEEEGLVQAKEANQRPEAESKETKHGPRLSQNTSGMTAAMLLIFNVGWSFGEAQDFDVCGEAKTERKHGKKLRNCTLT